MILHRLSLPSRAQIITRRAEQPSRWRSRSHLDDARNIARAVRGSGRRVLSARAQPDPEAPTRSRKVRSCALARKSRQSRSRRSCRYNRRERNRRRRPANGYRTAARGHDDRHRARRAGHLRRRTAEGGCEKPHGDRAIQARDGPRTGRDAERERQRQGHDRRRQGTEQVVLRLAPRIAGPERR